MSTRITVRLTPRASRTAIEFTDSARLRDATLRVWVTAPAIDGRANRALERLLAKQLSVARGSVRVVAGERSREKVIEVTGLDEAELRERLITASG